MTPPDAASTSATADYLVISRGQWEVEKSPEEIQGAIDRFYSWLDGLVSEGKMKPGQRLKEIGGTVTKKGLVLDGPFGESKEVIGGYWFIVASSLEEAMEIAAQNPCLEMGLFYEIREIEPKVANAFERMTETPRGS